MTETLYGPWKIVLTHVNSHFSQSVEITGSDNADGRYDVAFGQAFELEVAGSEWQIELAYLAVRRCRDWQAKPDAPNDRIP